MNRSAKATIFLLVLLVGILTWMLFYQNHKEHNHLHEIRLNSQYGIAPSQEISALTDVLEKEKNDSAKFAYDYEWIRNDLSDWNNSRVFSLAYIASDDEDCHDSLSAIYRAYGDASVAISGLMNLREHSSEFEPGEIDTLIKQMRKLANATARFENFDFEEYAR